jgi:hypothetical protein
MVGDVREWWGEFQAFDRVGVALAVWQFSIVGAAAISVPHLGAGLSELSFRLLVANGIGAGAAVTAWVITLALFSRRESVAGETVQQFVARQLLHFRRRRGAA